MSSLVCSDLTDLSSFERAKFWVNELKQTEEVCVSISSKLDV